MKKLLIATAALITSLAVAKSTTYDGEFYADTKGSAPSSAPWVHPTNVVNIANKVFHAWWDPFEANYLPGTSVNFYNNSYYPSYTYGDYNVNLGIDSEVGVPTYSTGSSSISADRGRYSVAIGTSNKAIGMHSYAWGSQLNVVTSNATAIGYGITAADQWSTVIGHGRRPTTNGINYDYTNTTENVLEYLRSMRNNVFPGFHLHATDTHKILTVTKVLSVPNASGFYYEWIENDRDVYVKVAPGTPLIKLAYNEFYYSKDGETYTIKTFTEGDVADDNTYRLFSPDYIHGKYDWRYGKTHGPGTFNIVAWGMPGYSQYSPGLKAVYINDDRLDYLVRKEIAGPNVELTNVQKSKNIGFDGSGYDENSPVELGVNASAALNPTVVAGVTTSGTKLRNAGIAIGARAVAEGASDLKNQNISIGLAAYSSGSSMIAIGPGSKDSTETDWTGNNTFASGPGKNGNRGGSASTAIGYSAKAWGTQALAIGSGDSGTSKPATIASNDYTTAVGPAAQAMAPKAVAIGRYARAEAEGAVQIGTGTNSTPNSLQFMDVKIVENGRLLGGNADPKEAVIPAEDITATGAELSIKLNPGSVYTVLPEANCGPGTELIVEEPVGGLRNYEVYLPNEPEMCAGLPAGFSLDEIPGNIKKIILNNKWQAYKLPAKITIKQPYSKLVIGEITEFDDGTDWSPIITDAHVKWDGTKFTADGSKLLEGTNLHAGVSLKIRYPISGGTTITREVAGVTSLNTDGILDGTFYNYTISFDYTPVSGETPVATSGTIIPITLIYETKCGTRAAEFTVNYDTLP